MNETFLLKSTYEYVIEFKMNTRPIRIEIFLSLENNKKYRVRVWDQNTYNLYPTFANMPPGGGIENKMMSCDEVNREITTLVAETPEVILGMEWESEASFLNYLKKAIDKYREKLDE